MPSSDTSTTTRAVADLDPDAHDRGVRVLGHVRQRLRDQVVRTSLDRLRQPLVRDVHYLDRDRRPPRERLDGGAQALLGEHGRVEPTGELTELVERERELVAGVCEGRPHGVRIGVEPAPP